MKKIIISAILAAAGLSAPAAESPCTLRQLGDGHSIVTLSQEAKFILLPIQDAANESRIVVVNNNQARVTINVRLAKDKVDYYMPFEVVKGDALHVHVPQSNRDAANLHTADLQDGLWMRHIKSNDTYTVGEDEYRPDYHFTPEYGWMNDPNGMVYKDGKWHLYYQWNPYASVWGNMTWGHAVSTDLVHWTQMPAAITPDAVGAVFSGSSIVDKNNDAGFGKDAIVAFYTSAAESQTQSLAYSTDGGNTFTKYEGNPIITSTARDFRDPKVFWHEDTKKWIMALAVGQVIQFHSSTDLKNWHFESEFGKGEGCHDGVWECPDLVQLPIEGTDAKQWVLIVNINPGGPYGGSATQYFVGDFNGKIFVNTNPGETKWMDYGKDHYATVTWSNAPDNRCVAIAWMNNWEYANSVPVKYYSSSNSIPRDLSLYSVNGKCYLKSAPAKELYAAMSPVSNKKRINVSKKATSIALPKSMKSSYMIEFTLQRGKSESTQFSLINSRGEKVVCSLSADSLTVDRTQSGKIDFSDSFAAITKAPTNRIGNIIKVNIFVDKSSIEVFGNDGEFVITDLVFPNEPYSKIEFSATGGKSKISNFKIFDIEL